MRLLAAILLVVTLGDVALAETQTFKCVYSQQATLEDDQIEVGKSKWYFNFFRMRKLENHT